MNLTSYFYRHCALIIQGGRCLQQGFTKMTVRPEQPNNLPFLSNLVTEPTFFLRNLLDLFLTSYHKPYQTFISIPLGYFNHGLITVSWTKEDFPEVLPPCMIWHFRSANWSGLREFFFLCMEHSLILVHRSIRLLGLSISLTNPRNPQRSV